MAPLTRSGRHAQASSSKRSPDGHHDSDDLVGEPAVMNGLQADCESPQLKSRRDSTTSTLQSLLTRALGGAKELERENASLHQKVKALENKLDRLVEADDVPIVGPSKTKRTAATTAQLRSEVNRLRRQVQRLEKSNQKHRKRIHQLSMKELKTEAEELVDAAEFEVGDSAYKMRKLLRRFHDLMLANSLDENEECLICMEPLQPKKSCSLPCQHTFCDDCVRRLQPEPNDPELIRCPTCRASCLRDDTEIVEFTASEQWDALLDVAKQWAKMDVRRAEDTSEEEDAEEFIDDGLEESSTTTSEPPAVRVADPLHTSPEPQGEEPEPLTPSRLRKKRTITTPTPEGELDTERPMPTNPEAAQPEAGPSATAAASEPSPAESMPPLPVTPMPGPQRTRSYSQSPSKDKRKMLEQLAEARNKKRRL